MSLLFTGFGLFGDVDYNPSWDAAQAAAEAADAAAELLPVTLDTARTIGTRIEPGWLIVSFGVARRREQPMFERYAHNWWRDLDEHRPRRLDATGPVARECALPVDSWAAALGFTVSHDAGMYVCNATLYYALAATPRAGFIHIPPVDAAGARDIGRRVGELLRDAG